MPGEIADKFHATFDALLYNFYGPTETVVNATSYPVEGAQGTRVVPIGRPKINTQVHLLDDALQPVPVGVIGEIYIGGTHVARTGDIGLITIVSPASGRLSSSLRTCHRWARAWWAMSRRQTGAAARPSTASGSEPGWRQRCRIT